MVCSARPGRHDRLRGRAARGRPGTGRPARARKKRNSKNQRNRETGQRYALHKLLLYAHRLLPCPGNRITTDSGHQQRRQKIQEIEPVNAWKRPQPATKKKRGGDRADHNHVRVLTKKIKSPAEAAILGHVPGNQLGFSFWKIKGRSIGLSDRSDYVNIESDGGQEYIPNTVGFLRFDNRVNS